MGGNKDVCVPFYDDIRFCVYFLEDALTVHSAINFCRVLRLRSGRIAGFAFVNENEVLAYQINI